MRKVMAIVAGLVVLALIGSMTLASAGRRDTGRRWGMRVSTAQAAPAPAPHGEDESLLVLQTRNEHETEVDNPPEGESQGDEIALTASLFRQGQKVGRLDAHAVETEANFQLRRAAIQVTFTATLRRGQITATGVAVFTPQSQAGFEAAVTGGTGNFDEAGGSVDVSFLRTGTRFVYDLEDL